MWFRFPEGATQISISNQLFEVEVKDDTGVGYFRAPDHFAPQILDLKGFARANPPEGAPPDLPSTLGELTGQEVNKLSAALSAKDLELGLVKSSLAEVSAERDDLKIMLHEAQARVLELEEEIEGLKKPAGTTSTSASTSTSTSASLGSTSVSSSSAGR